MSTEGAVPTLLIDDHPVVRTGLASYLRAHAGVTVVGEAGSVAETRAWLDRQAGDPAPVRLAIVDLRLPDGNGADLIPELRRRLPQARILVLSSVPDEAAIRRALHAGAHGWLDKEQDPRALADAVRAVLRGERPLSHAAVDALVAVPPVDPLEALTRREREVLRAIGSGASNREIAERLGIREKTVKTHAGAVYAKLGLARRAQAVRVARDAWPDDDGSGDGTN